MPRPINTRDSDHAANQRIVVTEYLTSLFGGVLGIFLVYHASHSFVGESGAVWILASMGASAVLLFGVPHAAFAQPWPLFAGHGVSALIGVTCAQWITDPALAGACAVGLAIIAMRLGRCTHPPGGGTALVAVIGGTGITTLGYQYVLAPVLLNALLLFVTALLVNAPFAWRRYPIRLFHALAPKHATPDLTQDSILQAMEETHGVVDVTAEELLELAQRAVQHSRDNAKDIHPLHGRVLRLATSTVNGSQNTPG